MPTTLSSSRPQRVGIEPEARTLAFAVQIVEFSSTFPRSDAATVVVRQLLRSGTSIGANYREANRAESKEDFAHKVSIALKEAAETEYWLLLCAKALIGDTTRLVKLQAEANELIAILSTILRRTRTGASLNSRA